MGQDAIGRVGALRSANDISRAQLDITKNFERLSSGRRINRAGDDAAGLGISQGLHAEMSSLQQSSRNIDYGSSRAQITDGALASQGGIVSRMRELAVQSSNGTLGNDQRAVIQTEFAQLSQELDRIAATTEFNGQALLTGESTEVQVGTGGDANSRIAITAPNSDVATLGLTAVDLSSAAGAQAALASFDTAIQAISTSRANVGATMNRLDVSRENNASTMQNVAAAASRIADTDIASESSALAGNEIKLQSSISLAKQQNITAGLLVNLIA